MGLYLSLVLMALIVSFERSLDDGGELLMIWGSSIGLTLAHVLAFRVAYVYEHGSTVGEGWVSIGGMFAAAFGVALLASVPYAVAFQDVKASSLTTVVLLAVIGFGTYLAGRSRGWSGLRNLGYIAIILVVASSVSVVKYILTH
ncbi:MAG: hypothetical protein U9N84_02575 [Actinomycetota bacterium]|nr:hypothetical protein [Actinomycetota bacterium]